MSLRAWSELHLHVWRRWPVLAMCGHYGFWLGFNAGLMLVLQQVWPAPDGTLPSMLAVTLTMLATARMIAVYLNRPLRHAELWLGSLLCALIAALYVCLSGALHSPALPRGLSILSMWVLFHLVFFGSWFQRLLRQDKPGAMVQGSTPTRYFHFWATRPVGAALAHYALFLLTFALATHGLFGEDNAMRHPQRGFLVVLLFVMPWLYAIHAPRGPDMRAWLVLTLGGAALYWSTGFATGEIRPASSLQMLESLAVTLLYHLVMFSPWWVNFWRRLRAA